MQKTMRYLSGMLFFLAVMTPAEAHAFAITAALGLAGGFLTSMGLPGIGGAVAGAFGTFNATAFAIGFQSVFETRQHQRMVKAYRRIAGLKPMIEHRWPSETLSPEAYLDKLQPLAPFGMTDALAVQAKERRIMLTQPVGTLVPPTDEKPYAVGKCLGPDFPERTAFDFSPQPIQSGDLVMFICHAQTMPMVKRFCGRREDGAWMFYQRVPEMIIAVPADMLLHIEKITGIDLPDQPGAEVPLDAMSEAIGGRLLVKEVAADDLPSLGDWHFALQAAFDEMRARYAEVRERHMAAA